MAGSSGRFDPADPLPGEDPERLDAVAPGDLLPLVPGPGRIADRYFIGPDTPAQQLAGHLGLHSEPTRPHVQRPVQLHWHEFETGLQIPDVRVEQDVRGE